MSTSTNTNTNTNTNTEDKKEQQRPEEKKDDKQEESMYNEQIINRVIISIKPMSFYVDRARRALRLHESITIIGFDNFISAACTVVETLKRQKIAHIEKIETTMDTPLLTSSTFVTFARPVPKITIHLRRGELALYLSGFYQRKMIEIFENADKNATGRLTHDEVVKLELLNAFHATDDQKQRGLKEIEGKSHITLPEFIRFTSHAVHPKLRDDLFKQILQNRYGIRFGNQQGDDDDDKLHDENANNNRAQQQNNALNNGNNHDDNQ